MAVAVLFGENRPRIIVEDPENPSRPAIRPVQCVIDHLKSSFSELRPE
jgi:hypothetical protein